MRAFIPLAVLLATLVACRPAAAREDIDAVCDKVVVIDDGYGFVRFFPPPCEVARRHYATYGQPRLGIERRLANGAAWWLWSEETTGLAIPRLTWMPDTAAMLRANRIFQEIHGALLLHYNRQSRHWFAEARAAANVGPMPNDLPRRRFVWQPPDGTAVTYASVRWASYVDIWVEEGRGHSLARPHAAVLDLARDRAVYAERCDEDAGRPTLGRPFHLGDLLDLCSSPAHAAFVALWRKAEAKLSAEMLQHHEIALALAPHGLLVRLVPQPEVHPSAGRPAALDVVIDYRDLAPFLQGSALRDTLGPTVPAD